MNTIAYQNRVTPFSQIIATSARGTWMGNRGCLHNAHQQIRRGHLGQRWIICLLTFKNRHRPIMAPGQYTELFFLDEATAFAAGHRPCAECQRERFNLFRTFWAQANPEATLGQKVTAVTLDAHLHPDRLTPDGQQRTFTAPLSNLPNGTFLTLPSDRDPFLLYEGHLLRWTPFGYSQALAQPAGLSVQVLTPFSVVQMLALGYPLHYHFSASTLL